jgi:TolB-like protein
MLFINNAFSAEETDPVKDKPYIKIEKIAVMPFSSKLTGVGETMTTKEQFLTDSMYGELTAKVKGIEFISPQSSGEELTKVGEDNSILLDKSAVIEAGKNLGADAVLFGYISEYKEREGGELGVSSAASVAFSVQLLNTKDGQILWEDYFAETQRPLSENLLEVRKFFRRGAKWITADDLAKEGIVEVVNELNMFLVKFSATTEKN